MIPSSKVLGLLLTTTVALAQSQCDIAGPGFPAPSNLSDSELLIDAVTKFEDLLGDVESGLLANDTAWTVALFSSKENRTLYEYYHTPDIDVGVPTVDENSVFRIASISKVFSVWSFLIEVGDEHFGDPITKYVPELLVQANSSSGREPREVYDDIDHVRWEEVTLGQLASHAAGIPRDREPSVLLNHSDTWKTLTVYMKLPRWICRRDLGQSRYKPLGYRHYNWTKCPYVVFRALTALAIEAVRRSSQAINVALL